MRKTKGYSKGGARMMRARGGKMAKGYSKGGARMMRAMGGKMAKGYSKGGARMMRARGGKMAKGMAVGGLLPAARAAKMGVTTLRAAAKKLGYGLTKVKTPKAKPADFLTRRASLIGRVGAAGAAGAYLGSKSKKKDTKKLSPFGKAFSTARKAGKKTFTFKGKKYTTKLKK